MNVAAGAGLVGTPSPAGTSCVGINNGTITLTMTTGAAPFTAIMDGTITQTSASNIISFAGLVAGTHSINVTDANGCVTTSPITTTVAAGSGFTAAFNPTSTSCAGALNGKLVITPQTPGAAPFTVVLNPGAITQTSATSTITFNNLAAGSYSAVVTDANGCQYTLSNMAVSPGPSINVRPDKIDARCFNGLTGSITAVPSSNATAPIQYSLDNVTWQASPNFPGLGAGTYNVYIMDAVGCRNSADTTIGQPAQLQATTSQQTVLCNSASNGKIVVAATGGTTPYYYSLNGSAYQTNNTFSVPAGSNYTIDVKDANGCTIPQLTNISVMEPAALAASSLTSNATCDGGSDGTITITPTGGTSPYQFAITGGTFQPANYFYVGPGTYDITVKDVNGCSYPVNAVVVGLTNNLTYTHMTDPPAVCESKAAQLQLLTNATQFAWTNAGSLSNSTIANPMATPPIPTLYRVTATLGRCSIVDSVYVNVMPAPTADAGPPGDICYGKTYQLQGSGGAAYAWTPSTYLSSYTDYNPVVKPEKTITYYLTVTDANGCASLTPAQVMVKVTPPIKVNVYPVDTIVAGGVKVPYLATSAGTYYVWTNTASNLGLDNPNIPNPIATAPLADGSVVIYKITATTSAGCQGETYARIQVYKGPDLYMVTGFTPNADGKNDVFVPIPVGIKKLNYFRVVDHWGLTVFLTKELNRGWDGRYRGAEQASGVFVWMVEGVTMDNKLITKKGTVTLIR
jgi:gliding motility-associated-like protein